MSNPLPDLHQAVEEPRRLLRWLRALRLNEAQSMLVIIVTVVLLYSAGRYMDWWI